MAILDYINDALSSSLRRRIHEAGEYTLSYIKFQIKHLEKKIIKTIISLFLIGLSVAFLSISAIYSLIEYAGLSISLSFFSIGITLLLIGIIVKVNN